MGDRLKGKVALVTGGASGIGEATARVFVREGAKVAVADLRGDGAERVASEIRAAGGAAIAIAGDTSVEADARRMVEETERAFGSLDAVVNAAGIECPKPILDTTEEEWDRVMDVNAKGVFLVSKHAIPAMRRAGGGSIVNVSSVLGLIGSRAFAAYHASKGAVRLLTKTTALSHAREGIRANSIHPGIIDTPMVRERIGAAADPAAEEARWARVHPMRRFGKPEEVAYAAVYLASDEAAFVTGSELVIDGGWTAA